MLRGGRGAVRALLCALSLVSALVSALAETPSCPQYGLPEDKPYCEWTERMTYELVGGRMKTRKHSCATCAAGKHIQKTCSNSAWSAYDGHCCSSDPSFRCTDCPWGYWRSASSESCQCSTAGWIPNTAKSDEVACQDGYGSEYCSGACSPCAAGSVSSKGVRPGGVRGDFDTYGCYPCKNNYVPTAQKDRCASCNTVNGFFSKSGDSQCQYCPKGQYRTGDMKQYQCQKCAAGSYRDETHGIIGEKECWHCENGKYQPNIGQAACSPCSGTVHNHRTMCCSATEYWNGNQCVSQQYATLKDRSGVLTIVDNDKLDGQTVPSGYYLVFGTRKMTQAQCGQCTRFEYKISCQPIYETTEVDSLVVKIGETSLLVSEWKLLGTSTSEIVQGTLERLGACVQCEHCDKGFYIQNCNSNQGKGNCFPCRQACVNKNSYLIHPYHLGCGNEYRFEGDKEVVVYQAQVDYGCATCDVWRRTDFDKYILLVGCAGAETVVRWHPTGEVDAAGVLQERTCVLTGGTSDPALEECYHNGVQFSSKSEVLFPSGQDLLFQAFTQTMPYCPPGWRVKADCKSLTADESGELDLGARWDRTCCERCAACPVGEAQSVEWEQCDGMSTVDTQLCVSACAAGQFRDGGTCRECTTCQ